MAGFPTGSPDKNVNVGGFRKRWVAFNDYFFSLVLFLSAIYFVIFADLQTHFDKNFLIQTIYAVEKGNAGHWVSQSCA